MKQHKTAIEELLTPAEVAAMLFVDPKTVTRWARAGKLDAIRTPGGHRRYLKSDVIAIMTGVHHSQQRDPGAAFTPPSPRAEMDGSDEAAASEAVAAALELEAWDAAEAVVLTAAAVAAAAEKAAAAASRAREARAFAAAEAALTVAGHAVRTAAAEAAADATAQDTPSAAASEPEAVPAAGAQVPAQRLRDITPS